MAKCLNIYWYFHSHPPNVIIHFHVMARNLVPTKNNHFQQHWILNSKKYNILSIHSISIKQQVYRHQELAFTKFIFIFFFTLSSFPSSSSLLSSILCFFGDSWEVSLSSFFVDSGGLSVSQLSPLFSPSLSFF